MALLWLLATSVRDPSIVGAQTRGNAEEPWAAASGSVGAGVFGARAAAALDVGVDFAGASYAMGLGARLRFLTDGLRTEDWDERSEWAKVVRYLSYQQAHGALDVALAAGELGGATLGHGGILQDYSSVLDLDHRHLGAQLRIDGDRFSGEGVIDDLIAPRILGTRGSYSHGPAHRQLSVGASLLADLSAPARDGMMPTTEALPLAALDGQWSLTDREREFGGAVYAQLVAISTMAAGLHLGLTGRARASGRVHLWLRGELRLGSDRYIPGWLGPLYEIERQARRSAPPDPMDPPGPTVPGQLERARLGGLAGLGGRIAIRAHIDQMGELSVSIDQRVGLPDQLVARVSAPYFRDVQGAAWMAAELGEGADSWVMAGELRARIDHRFFASAEVARMYRERDGLLSSLWLAMASFGASLEL